MPDADDPTPDPLRCERCDSRIRFVVTHFKEEGGKHPFPGIQAEYIFTCDCTEAGTRPEQYPDHWPEYEPYHG